MSRINLAPAFLVLLASAAPAQVHPEPRETRPEMRIRAPADFSTEGLTRRVELLRPDIEAVLGNTLGPPIRAIPATAVDLERILLEELGVQQSNINGGPRGAALREAVSRSVRILGRALLAKVDFLEGTIHVVPDLFEEFARLYTNEDRSAILGQDLLDVVLAHEAAHVFQYRTLGLAKFVSPQRTSDELSCRGAVLEGHADFVARRVAARRGLTASFELFRRIQASPPPSIRGGLDRQFAQLLATSFSFQYVEGERFLTAVSADLGPREALARLFSDPPRTQRSITHPDEYLRPDFEHADLAASAERVRQVLSQPGFKTQVIGMPPAMLRQVLAPLGTKTVDATLAGLIDAQVVTAMETANPKMLSVAIMSADSPDSARILLDAEVALLKKKDEMARSGALGTIDLISSECDPITWERGQAYFFVKKLFASRSDVTTSGLLVRDGSIVWEIQGVLSKFREPESQPAETAESRSIPESREEGAPFGSRAHLIALAQEIMRGVDTAPVAKGPSRRSKPRVQGPIVHVKGHVAYPDGEAHDFTVRLWDVGSEHAIVSIHGRDGLFDVDLPLGPCRIGRIIADGDDHDGLIGDLLTIEEDKDVQLAIARPDVITVAAVDASTNAPIPGARVYGLKPRSSCFRTSECVPPFEDLEKPPLITGSDGQVRMLRRTVGPAPRWIYVVAPGHAWAGARVPDKGSKDIRAELKSGGDLEVHVDGWERLGIASLWISPVRERDLEDLQSVLTHQEERASAATRPADFVFRPGRLEIEDTKLTEPDARGDVKVEGLSPGTWVVTVAQGRQNHSSGSVLAARLATIAAGEMATASFSIPALPHPVSVHCNIEIAEGWRGAEQWGARLVGDDDLTSGVDDAIDLAGDDRIVEFSAPRVTPGRYVVRLPDAGWQAPIEVQTGATSATFALPAPYELSVSIEAEGSKRRPPKTAVVWTPILPTSTAMREDDLDRLQPASPATENARGYSILAAPGRIRVRVSAPEYATITRVFDGAAGKKEECIIQLPRPGKIEVALEPEEGLPPIGTVRVVPAAGAEPTVKWTRKGKASFDDLAPGEYTVTVAEKDLEGIVHWEPAEQRITVRAGEKVQVVFKVLRGKGADPPK